VDAERDAVAGDRPDRLKRLRRFMLAGLLLESKACEPAPQPLKGGRRKDAKKTVATRKRTSGS